jgi:hypothetical protein
MRRLLQKKKFLTCLYRNSLQAFEQTGDGKIGEALSKQSAEELHSHRLSNPTKA